MNVYVPGRSRVKVAEALCRNSGRERTAAVAYARENRLSPSSVDDLTGVPAGSDERP